MGVSFYVAFENSIKKPPFEIRHAIYLAFRPTGDYTLITHNSQYVSSSFQVDIKGFTRICGMENNKRFANEIEAT